MIGPQRSSKWYEWLQSDGRSVTITPVTANTANYHWAWMRNYALDSQLLTTQIRDGIRNVFTEDTGMLQAQQKAIEANPEYEFYNLNIDAGGMWIRRFIERALAAEGRLKTAG